MKCRGTERQVHSGLSCSFHGLVHISASRAVSPPRSSSWQERGNQVVQHFVRPSLRASSLRFEDDVLQEGLW